MRVRSASVIGLYVSYVTPIFLRITTGRDKLQHGPFSLGKWYMPIGIVAVAWVSSSPSCSCSHQKSTRRRTR